MPASTSTKTVKSIKPVRASPGKRVTPLTGDAFGPPPLLEGEDPAAYDALLKGVRESVEPEGFIEDMWVRDVVVITWDILRARHIKASIINLARPIALSEMLEPQLRYDTKKLVNRWGADDASARKEVLQLLASTGRNLDDVNARAFALRLDVMERLDRIIAQAEARRNQTLREIERRRDTLARRLRERVSAIQDGEFKVVADGALAGPEHAP